MLKKLNFKAWAEREVSTSSFFVVLTATIAMETLKEHTIHMFF